MRHFILPDPLITRFLQIFSIASSGNPCLQMEVFGCAAQEPELPGSSHLMLLDEDDCFKKYWNLEILMLKLNLLTESILFL